MNQPRNISVLTFNQFFIFGARASRPRVVRRGPQTPTTPEEKNIPAGVVREIIHTYIHYLLTCRMYVQVVITYSSAARENHHIFLKKDLGCIKILQDIFFIFSLWSGVSTLILRFHAQLRSLRLLFSHAAADVPSLAKPPVHGKEFRRIFRTSPNRNLARVSTTASAGLHKVLIG